MCTVTFIARRKGYALGMNRDEKLARITGLPPARHRLGNRDAVFPSEPTGGTWVGVNDSGVSFALINWYSVPNRVIGPTVSRGEVVKLALSFNLASEVAPALAQWTMASVNPFRFVGIFPAQEIAVEWRWDLQRLEILEHPWRSNTWISSGFDEPGAQQTRGKAFHEAFHCRSIGNVSSLLQLHRSHGPERGPYSTCMHRADAATVSYTELHVSHHAATMRYVPGAPCSTSALPALCLQLHR